VDRSKAEQLRKRERHQAALDLREVLKTDAGKRWFARLLHRTGVYVDAPTELQRGKRLFGLDLERDVLRVAGERTLAELRHIIFAELMPETSAEVVSHAGDSSDP
jgi:hypothetical protein